MEFEIFQEYIDGLVDDDKLARTCAQDRHSDNYNEQWYKCKQCAQIWSLLYPDHDSFTGRWRIVKKGEPLGGASYITYATATTEAVQGGRVTAQVIIIVVNTGEAPLFLDTAAYDLEDTNGEIIATSPRVQAFPQIIQPEESGYYFDTITIDRWNKVAPFTVLLRPHVTATHLDSVRFEVPEFHLGNRVPYTHGLNVLGRVKNTTNKPYERIIVAGMLFDKKEQPVGAIFSQIREKVPPGAKVGFSGLTETIMKLTCEDVVRYEVFAFPPQWRDEV